MNSKFITYFGEDELLSAFTEIGKEIDKKNICFPIISDASYVHERFGFVSAKVVFDEYINKYKPDDKYKLELLVEINGRQSKRIVLSGDKNSISLGVKELALGTNIKEQLAFLRNLYRGLLD
jgi:hypothetical protein